MEEMRIVKSASCPSVSGKSDLTYDIGCDSGSAIYLRITGSTGGGIWNKTWIPLAQFEPLLTKGEAFTAKMMRSAFQGMSVNTIGFVIAALIQENFLARSDGEKHKYLPINPSEFHDRIKSLADNTSPMSGKGVKGKGAIKEKPEGEISGDIDG